MAMELESELGLGCDRAGSLGARRRQPCLCQRLAGLGLGLCQRLRLGLCLCQLVLRLQLRLGRLATGLVFAGMSYFVLHLLASLSVQPHHHEPSTSPPNASYARFRPLIGLILFSSRLFPPIAGISLLHND
ncbi:hypothetical protein J3E69DRAFT_336786 [Trichoderma sp. SZMC 28015]